MKKLMLLALFALLAMSVAMAQTYVPTQDVLGAHNNGGRGCAGCHAPHSGAGGAGAAIATTSDRTHSGDDALFGQDLGPLYGVTLGFGSEGSFTETLPAAADWAVGTEEIRGIMMCLACHDGAVARGAMMTNQAYEKRMGMLPSSYGTGDIPTLLGADGWGTGYNNDHPVGKAATLGAAHLSTSQLTITFGANNSITNIVPVAGSTYESFVADYGMPAIAGTPWAWGVASDETATTPSLSTVYLLCTTCHNQHAMNVYKAPPAYTGKPGVNHGNRGTYKTYFFINAPYNVDLFNQGTTFTNMAASTTQFCRQCHFSTSNEAYGLNLNTQF